MTKTRVLAAVRRAIATSGAGSVGETVVVAVSGGADSVALADAVVTVARESSIPVVLAHLDHRLRPESGEDARFCVTLGESWGVPVRVGRADVRARAARDHAGLEDAARRERYAFLEAVRAEVGARFVALGHTRDDQAETFLLRLLRGAGADGLSAMRMVAGDRLRPMLEVTRADVLDHLHARGLSWREDASNADTSLLRNRVRHELLPYLESRFNPGVRDALVRSAEILSDEAEAFETTVDAVAAEALRREGTHVTIALETLRQAPPALARRLLRRALHLAGGLQGVSAHHVEALRALVGATEASGHRVSLPGHREALVCFERLRIGPAAAPVAAFNFPLSVPGRVELPNGQAMVAEPAAGPRHTDATSAVISVPTVAGLVVRTRRPGDRVEVGGRDVSLKRFLMSRRVPSTDRFGLPLVASGRDVFWIPGVGAAAGSNAGTCIRVQVESR